MQSYVLLMRRTILIIVLHFHKWVLFGVNYLYPFMVLDGLFCAKLRNYSLIGL